MEDSLDELENVDFIRSYALQGFAFTIVGFTPESDMESSLEDLKRKFRMERLFLLMKLKLKITQVSFDDVPILIINIFGIFHT